MGDKTREAGALRRALMLVIAIAASALLLLITFPPHVRGQPATYAQDLSVGSDGGIANIADFLQQCPTNDPRYSQFRNDFQIRKEGVVVGAIACSEPISAMPVAQYTDELIAAQTLRTLYYMEGGRTVPYPWTAGSFYDWLKSKIGGIDIRANNSHCCESYDGKWFVVLSSQGDAARNAARKWLGISARIALLGHETRHVDSFPHVGGCPLFPDVTYGCDQTYDERNLSPYGIQWWLNAKWLSGELNVGYACLSQNVVADIANGHLNADNNDYGRRFVDNSPPFLTMPDEPGGTCPGSTPAPTPTPAPTSSRTPSPTPTPTPTRTPSPTPTPAPSHTPTPAPRALTQGDVDCTGTVSALDALKQLRFVARLPVSQTGQCPRLGEEVDSLWGDVDCDGAITSVDALMTLRHVAGLTVSQHEPCPDIGSSVE